jgi:hypothetical protein
MSKWFKNPGGPHAQNPDTGFTEHMHIYYQI